MTLTEDERATLLEALRADVIAAMTRSGGSGELLPTVEAILTARLALLEALADEWERKADNAIAHDQMMRAGRLTHAARRLRAALAAAPSREGES